MHTLDRALDLAVVPGYIRLGSPLRSRGWDELPRMDGRVVLVTGATSGIGLAASTAFAELGASVHLIARNAERGERARGLAGAERVWECDVSSLRSVGERLRAGFRPQGTRAVPAHRPARAGARGGRAVERGQRLFGRHVHRPP